MPAPDLPSPIPEEELFLRAATERPAAERPAYLAAACEGQPELLARVERMIEMRGIVACLQQPVDEPLPPEVEAELARLKPEEGGERIGNYRLIEQIGEGGFGVVWMAEQIEPVRRRVALKILRLGMDTKEVIARFEQERQALAMMDHPHIARVFDAGATVHGRPFFVMELVHGTPLTDYCDEKNLPTGERLELFIAVCHAVQHAHQKGIIHRDLKPSNILVAVDDGAPVPKVIDFGVAKATQSQRLTDLTIHTEFEQMIGTPLYMSPEQVGMTGVDIDTRSDIYSLGVLLYELLTGRTPFDPEELMRQGVDQIRHAIREQEPQKPSTALSAMSAEARRTVAQHRQADAAKLAQQIRGDLDWIVMKAIEKDRTRRYESVSDFALDLRRHLASEPVAARAPSFGYQAGKFVRRHRGAVAAGGVVLVSLLAGLIASTVLYLRERAAWTSEAAQRYLAETSAQRAEMEAGKARTQMAVAKQHAEAEKAARREAEIIAEFLTGVFQSPDPARDGRTITVAELLDRAAGKLETELAQQPARRASLQTTLAATYKSLGLHREAIPLREKVRDYHLATFGPEDAATLAVTANLSESYAKAGRWKEALPMQRDLLSRFRKGLGAEHPNTIRVMSYLATSYVDAGRQAEAFQLRDEALPLARKVFGPEHPDTLGMMDNLASSYRAMGRPAEALRLKEETLELSRKVLGPEHPYTMMTMNNLAFSYADALRRKEALGLRQEVLALRRKVLGPEHPSTLSTMADLARSLVDVGRQGEALKMQEEVLSLCQKTLGVEHPSTLRAKNDLALSYGDAGRGAQATKLHEEVLADRRKLLGAEHPDTLSTMNNLALAYAAAGRQAEALELRELILPPQRNLTGPEHPATLVALNNLALSYAAAARWEDALKLQEEVWALRCKVLPLGHPQTLGAMTNLAVSYKMVGRLADAAALQKQALELKRRFLPPNHPFLRVALTRMAELEEKSGRAGEALRLREEALGLCREFNGAEHPETLAAFSSVALAYATAGRLDDALRLLAEASASRPKDTLLAFRVAALQAWFDRGADHAATSRALLALAAGTDKALIAERAAKACCLRAGADPSLLPAALALARQAVALGRGDRDLPRFSLALGMAEYRHEHYAEAMEALKAAEEGKDNPLIQCSARCFRAMTFFRQGRQAEARELLATAAAQGQFSPTDERQPFTAVVNPDNLVLWLACREAKKLIARDGTPIPVRPVAK
jgi:tetratricopeptide (TPR) repeat protein